MAIVCLSIAINHDPHLCPRGPPFDLCVSPACLSGGPRVVKAAPEGDRVHVSGFQIPPVRTEVRPEDSLFPAHAEADASACPAAEARLRARAVPYAGKKMAPAFKSFQRIALWSATPIANASFTRRGIVHENDRSHAPGGASGSTAGAERSSRARSCRCRGVGIRSPYPDCLPGTPHS